MTNRLVMTITRIALIAILAGIAVLWLINANARRQSNFEYFRQTGHNVRGEFLTFYRERDGLEIFGYPITEELIDKDTGLIVQYFQNSRMEFHPEAQPEQRVQLSPLAELMGKTTAPVQDIPPPNDPNRRYYPGTGHIVSFSFLSFFDAQGGVEVFGYPISEVFNEQDRLVQYFQRARLEYYADRPLSERVQIAHLGEIFFSWARLDPFLLRDVPARADDDIEPFRLRVTAAVETAHAAYPGQQTVHVYVEDASGQKLENVNVTAEVDFPESAKQFTLRTDTNGHAQQTFQLEPAAVGQTVAIRVSASFGIATGDTQASFAYWGN